MGVSGPTSRSDRPTSLKIAVNLLSIPLLTIDWVPGCDVGAAWPLRLTSSRPVPALIIPLPCNGGLPPPLPFTPIAVQRRPQWAPPDPSPCSTPSLARSAPLVKRTPKASQLVAGDKTRFAFAASLPLHSEAAPMYMLCASMLRGRPKQTRPSFLPAPPLKYEGCSLPA